MLETKSSLTNNLLSCIKSDESLKIIRPLIYLKTKNMSHFVIEQWKEYPIQAPGKVRYAVSNYGRLKSFTDTIENGKILKGAPTEGFLFLRYVRMCNGEKKYYFHALHKMVAELFIPRKSEDQEYVIININYPVELSDEELKTIFDDCKTYISGIASDYFYINSVNILNIIK